MALSNDEAKALIDQAVEDGRIIRIDPEVFAGGGGLMGILNGPLPEPTPSQSAISKAAIDEILNSIVAH